jgi:hypothetical protein
MTHAELEDALERECRRLGHYVWLARDRGPRQVRGWVDAVVLGRTGLLYVELKNADGRRTKYQVEVAKRLLRLGCEYRLWRPVDWTDGTITRELEAL